jgi:peroxiredoxin
MCVYCGHNTNKNPKKMSNFNTQSTESQSVSNLPSIVFFYETAKGKIEETFDFNTNVQTIKRTSAEIFGYVKETTYNHEHAQLLAFYITELIKELNKRDIPFVQKTQAI